MGKSFLFHLHNALDIITLFSFCFLHNFATRMNSSIGMRFGQIHLHLKMFVARVSRILLLEFRSLLSWSQQQHGIPSGLQLNVTM